MEKKYICKLCYREFNESEMIKNIIGEITDYCRTCNGILGKGVGYGNTMSEQQIDEWLTDIDKRKKLLKKNEK